jgi:hypothetical protein
MAAREPLEDIVAEAQRLVAIAAEHDAVARLLGGTAFVTAAGAYLPASRRAAIQDIDLATRKRDASRLEAVLTDDGYEPNATFNAINGATRRIYYDTAHRRHIDVFVDHFEMCHVIPIAKTLALSPVTLPLAELLLTKLQIVELNAKDAVDAGALLRAGELGDSDAEGTINVARLSALTAADWGLHRTVTMTLAKLPDHIADAEARAVVAAQAAGIEAAMADAPKTTRWKLRDRVGERVRWYAEPDEIAHPAKP